jgi:hypothetical protein
MGTPDFYSVFRSIYDLHVFSSGVASFWAAVRTVRSGGKGEKGYIREAAMIVETGFPFPRLGV